jgi:FlaG/FlaF family flagellin (archaellin)
MAVFMVKRNDTRPYLAVVLQYSDGSPVVLTGATVTFKMKAADGSLKVNAAAVVTDDLTGTVEYRPTVDDFDEAGRFPIEWQVTFADGTVQTFPTKTWDYVIVRSDLDVT